MMNLEGVTVDKLSGRLNNTLMVSYVDAKRVSGIPTKACTAGTFKKLRPCCLSACQSVNVIDIFYIGRLRRKVVESITGSERRQINIKRHGIYLRDYY